MVYTTVVDSYILYARLRCCQRDNISNNWALKMMVETKLLLLMIIGFLLIIVGMTTKGLFGLTAISGLIFSAIILYRGKCEECD